MRHASFPATDRVSAGSAPTGDAFRNVPAAGRESERREQRQLRRREATPSGVCPAAGGDPSGLVPLPGSQPLRTEACGRVESNHHSLGRRGYSALSSPVLGVRTESQAAGRTRTDTAGLTTPDARRYITAAKGKWKAGSAPRNRVQSVTAWSWTPSQLLYLSAVLPASLRRRHPLTGRPWGLVGPAARSGPRSAQPCSVTSRLARRRAVPLRMARVGFEPTISSS